MLVEFPDEDLPDVEYLKMGFDECVRKSKYSTYKISRCKCITGSPLLICEFRVQGISRKTVNQGNSLYTDFSTIAEI